MKRFSLLLTMLCVLAVAGFAQQKTSRPQGERFGEEVFGPAPVSEPLEASFNMKNVAINRGDGSTLWAHAMYIPPQNQSIIGRYYAIYKDGGTFSSSVVKYYNGEYLGAAEIVNTGSTPTVYASSSNLTNGYYKINEDNGEITNISQAVSMELKDMTYDYVNEKMYGLKNGDIYLVDKETGAVQQKVFDYASNSSINPIMAIAADLEGHLYAVEMKEENSSHLFRFNIGDQGVLDLDNVKDLGSTGFPCKYTQTMAFNHETNELFWWQYSDTQKNIVKITINGDNDCSCESLGTVTTEMGGLFFDFDGYQEYNLTYNNRVDTVTFTTNIEDHAGNIISNPTIATPGNRVTVVPTVDDCYNLSSVYYTVNGDETRHIMSMVDGVYSFVMPVGDVNIYAEPTPIQYTVSFRDWNGDELTVDPAISDISDIIVNCGNKVDEDNLPTLPKHYHKGYDCSGWVDKNGTSITDIPIEQNTIAYADYDTAYVNVHMKYKYEDGEEFADVVRRDLKVGDTYSFEPFIQPCYTIKPEQSVSWSGEVTENFFEEDDEDEDNYKEDYVVGNVIYTRNSANVNIIIAEEYNDALTLPTGPLNYYCGDMVSINYAVEQGWALRGLLVKDENNDTIPITINAGDPGTGTISFTIEKNVTVSVTGFEEISVDNIGPVCEGNSMELPGRHGFLADSDTLQEVKGGVYGDSWTDITNAAFDTIPNHEGIYTYRAKETNDYGTFYTAEQTFGVIGRKMVLIDYDTIQQNNVCEGHYIVLTAEKIENDADGYYTWSKGNTIIEEHGTYKLEYRGADVNEDGMGDGLKSTDAGYYYVRYTSGTEDHCATDPDSIYVNVMPLPQTPVIVTEDGKPNQIEVCHDNQDIVLQFENGALDPDDYDYRWLKQKDGDAFDTVSYDNPYNLTEDYGLLEGENTYYLEIRYHNEYEGCWTMSDPFTVNVKNDYELEIKGCFYTCEGNNPKEPLHVENNEVHSDPPVITSYSWYVNAPETPSIDPETPYITETEGVFHIEDESNSKLWSKIDTLQIWVMATDGECEFWSDTLDFYVNAHPEVILTNNYNDSIATPGHDIKITASRGTSVTLTVEGGKAPMEYVWQDGGYVNIPGAPNSPTFTVTEAGVYHVNVHEYNMYDDYNDMGCDTHLTAEVEFVDYWTSKNEYRDDTWYDHCLNTNGKFEITNQKEMAAFLYIVNNDENTESEYPALLNKENAIVFINNDIDMYEYEGTPLLWPVFDPQGKFTGTINGVGHTISNIRMNESNSHETIGVNNAHVLNLGFKDVNIENGDIVVYNNKIIENGYITRTLANADEYDVLDYLTLAQTKPNAEMNNFYANNINDTTDVLTASFFGFKEENDTITIGDVNSGLGNMAMPFNPSIDNSKSQQIYTVGQVGRRSRIKGMSLYLESENNVTANNVTVKLGQVASDKFVPGDDGKYVFQSDNGFKEVYSDNLTLKTGWNNIVFTDTLEYEGIANLMLCVDAKCSGESGAGFKVYKANDDISSIYYDDNDGTIGGSVNNNVIKLFQTVYSFRLDTIYTLDKHRYNAEKMCDSLNKWVNIQTTSNYHEWEKVDTVNYGWPIMKDLHAIPHNVYARYWLQTLEGSYEDQEPICLMDSLYYGDVFNFDIKDLDTIYGFKLGAEQSVNFPVSIPDADVYLDIKFDRKIHSVTVNYVDEHGVNIELGDLMGHANNEISTLAYEGTKDISLDLGLDVAKYVYDTVNITPVNTECEFNPAHNSCTITMDTVDITVNVKYNAALHYITVNYVDVTAPYTEANPDVVYEQLKDTLAYKETYAYPSPTLEHYTLRHVTDATVSGTMLNYDITYNVMYDPKNYNLSIDYRYANGTSIDDGAYNVNQSLPYKREYEYPSPDVSRYTPDIAIVKDTMWADKTWVVTYSFGSDWHWTDPEIRNYSWYNEEGTDFTISTAAQLGGLSALVNGMVGSMGPVSFEGKTITVESDEAIDLMAYLWDPIGGINDFDYKFEGTFNAGNLPITNMRVETGEVHGASRGFFGIVGEHGVVNGLNIGGEVDGYYHAAGVAGKNFGKIVNSVSNVKVTSEWEAGGIVAQNMGVVENCYNVDTLECTSAAVTRSDEYYVGGIVAENLGGTIVNCHNVGSFESGHGTNMAYYGGIVGSNSNSGRVEHCYWLNNIANGVGTGIIDDSCHSFTLGDETIVTALNTWTSSLGELELNGWVLSESEQYPVFGVNGETEILDVTETEDTEVVLYPNPTKNVINVVATGIKRVTVYNAYGQMVIDQELDGDKYSIDMSQFAAGSYMVRVYTEDGVASRGFIKIR